MRDTQRNNFPEASSIRPPEEYDDDFCSCEVHKRSHRNTIDDSDELLLHKRLEKVEYMLHKVLRKPNRTSDVNSTHSQSYTSSIEVRKKTVGNQSGSPSERSLTSTLLSIGKYNNQDN